MLCTERTLLPSSSILLPQIGSHALRFLPFSTASITEMPELFGSLRHLESAELQASWMPELVCNFRAPDVEDRLDCWTWITLPWIERSPWALRLEPFSTTTSPVAATTNQEPDTSLAPLVTRILPLYVTLKLGRLLEAS